MNNSDEWGVAMQGCAGVITSSINIALNEADKSKPLIYIEIGIGEGKTLRQVCKLFTELNIDFRVLGVDIVDGWTLNLDEFIENIKKYQDKVMYDLAGSPTALENIEGETVFIVLIDGDHTLEAVIEDFKQADRILQRGGLIMFHDSDEECQGADAFERQPKGIQVREAIENLGLIEGNENYELIIDHPGNPELGNRGIFIVRKR